MWTYEQLRSQILKLHTTEYSWENLPETLQGIPKAAVLIALVADDDTVKVWLTRRSELVSTHKGQVSFPGGKKDASDANAVETALREAHEEIGLNPSQVEVIGEMLPLFSIHQILITPVIGIVSRNFQPQPNDEVSLAFQLPLERFLSASNHTATKFESSLSPLEGYIHYFHDIVYGEDVTTFGLTATFAIQVACGVFERIPEYSHSINEDMTPEDPHKVTRRMLQNIVWAMDRRSHL